MSLSIVCDCHDSDKASVIINPESVNRQEILSLNPPVCYEKKNLLFIDGELFTVEKEIDPNNPYTVDVFEPEGTNRGWAVWENFYIGRSAGYIYKPYNLNVIRYGSRYCIYGYGAAYYARGRLVCIIYKSGRIITSSKLPYNIFPSGRVFDCTPDVCGLTINYLDGSTFNYGEVPCDVEVTQTKTLEISDNSGILKIIDPYLDESIAFQCGDRQCPPETCCNPCEGSALNCCYDENGKLIDSFIRRT